MRYTRLSLLAIAGLCVASAGFAEQKTRLGEWDVHYVVVPSSFFKDQVAADYDIIRGRDRAVMNLSILDSDQNPVAVALTGTSTNLLGQTSALEFRQINEGSAIYYLAGIKFTDRETLRFRVALTLPDGVTRDLAFQQQMFMDGR